MTKMYIWWVSLGVLIKEARLKKGLKVTELAANSGIDQALVSKFEGEKRLPTKAQAIQLSNALDISVKAIETERLAEKIVKMIAYEPYAMEAMMVAESRVEYLVSSDRFTLPNVLPELRDKLNRIDELRDRWVAQKPLNGSQLLKMLDHFKIQYTYESNRIEGNTLTLQETGLVVNEGITIGGKSMREHLEAVNHAEAVDFIQELITERSPISERMILELHGLILKGIDRENAGRYRVANVRIAGSEHIPPEHFIVPEMMEDYIHHYHMHVDRMHPVLLAAEMHERLASIHPFIDGNGRTSRLIMNLILLQKGYTLANLKGDLNSRLRYYKALESVQKDANPAPFYALVADTVEASLTEHLELT